ncbi:LLM class flavin-dependent oxidoreductase [Actinomadura sp. LD22]|uniref:LLM class flavin-dependent oxidoreductase n=2 Tax=Actinomadura physcomitrii TaxID=2650748 RepID=A0A6I4MHR8_9ACTN|nr:LLM class flavin-dependent oxidoreductase [Actinomadura physcomitrii]
MRAPVLGPESPAPRDLYRAALEQCAWAEERGFDAVYLAEHHGADDGYCPSPVTLAAAVAGRTARLELHFSALILPMHDPVRLAEDLAVLDLIAGPGRVHVYAGMGYRPHEYAMFGVDFADRVRVYETALDVLRRAWSGRPVMRDGQQITVTPMPATPGGPRLYVAGSARPSARRAVRMGLGYRPVSEELYRYYVEEAARAGLPDPGPFPAHGPGFLHVTEDPERDWPRLAPHLMHATNLYAQWATERGRDGENGYWRTNDGLEELKKDPSLWVVTPEECLRRCLALGTDWELRFHPLLGGLPIELSWAGLELFEAKVLPALAEAGRRPPAGK